MFANMRKGNPFETVDARVVNRTDAAVTLGEVLAFALNPDAPTTTGGELGGGPGTPTGTGTLTAPAPYGVRDGGWVNVYDPTAAAQDIAQFLCVVTDLLDGAGANNTEIVVRFQGEVTVNVASANYDIGSVLAYVSGTQLAAFASADGIRPVGYSLTEADSQTSINAMFFGWMAFVGDGNENNP